MQWNTNVMFLFATGQFQGGSTLSFPRAYLPREGADAFYRLQGKIDSRHWVFHWCLLFELRQHSARGTKKKQANSRRQPMVHQIIKKPFPYSNKYKSKRTGNSKQIQNIFKSFIAAMGNLDTQPSGEIQDKALGGSSPWARRIPSPCP